MKILAGSISLLALASLMFFACSSSDSSTPGAGGAAAGAAGTGGSAGTGGVAGKGGSAGMNTGGTSNGGSAGAPAGGSAGTSAGGTAGGGTGGASGAAGAGGSMGADTKIIFLHHSTGGVIWGGGVADFFTAYNTANSKTYNITEQAFPKDSPYGWKNYPFDYWNIWVKNAGPTEYQEEPTLEILTQSYNVIIFKHCFPVSGIEADGTPDVTDETKTVANYKLQYEAIKTKLHEFPNNRFVVWTGAALRESESNADQGQRAKDFFDWVKGTWDEKGDNIFVFDFWQHETEGGLYLTVANASTDSHPNDAFAQKVAPMFGKRVTDVIEGRGDTGSILGE